MWGTVTFLDFFYNSYDWSESISTHTLNPFKMEFKYVFSRK